MLLKNLCIFCVVCSFEFRFVMNMFPHVITITPSWFRTQNFSEPSTGSDVSELYAKTAWDEFKFPSHQNSTPGLWMSQRPHPFPIFARSKSFLTEKCGCGDKSRSWRQSDSSGEHSQLTASNVLQLNQLWLVGGISRLSCSTFDPGPGATSRLLLWTWK